MYTKLSIPERLKDLRVVDKHLTLEQLAEQTVLSKSTLANMRAITIRTSVPLPSRRWQNFTECPPIT